MSNFKPKTTINITEALRRVWQAYPCASEMPEGDSTDTRRYKAMRADDPSQTVYLIANPSSWVEKRVAGRRVRIRPIPEVLGKLSDGLKDDAPIAEGPRGDREARQIAW